MRLPFMELVNILTRITYKTGWNLTLRHVEDGVRQEMNNLPEHALFLHTVAFVQNSRELSHRHIIPIDGGAIIDWPHSEDEFIKQVQATLRDDEAHEFNEFFRVYGVLAHDMHDPDNDIGGPAVVDRSGQVIARVTAKAKGKRNEAFNSLTT